MVHAEVRGAVLHIVLDGPPANALGADIIGGLSAAVERFETGDSRVAVVSSALPGVFAAGADIKLMTELTVASFAQYRDDLREPVERLAACGRPTIAAIDGLALGGGLELAMACTLRVATARSALGVPEVKLGLIPGAGGTQRLPRLIGRGRALRMTLTGDPVDGTEAERIGLVDRLAPAGQAVEAALAIAEQLAGYPAAALAALLACADAADGPFGDGMAFEGDEVVRMVAEGEAPEGIAAFVAKRRPVFSHARGRRLPMG